MNTETLTCPDLKLQIIRAARVHVPRGTGQFHQDRNVSTANPRKQERFQGCLYGSSWKNSPRLRIT